MKTGSPHTAGPSPWSLSHRAASAQEQPISDLIAQAVADPQLISLAAGLVDYDTLPVDDCRTLCETLLTDDQVAKTALQYGTTQGLAPLREAMFQHLAQQDHLTLKAMPGSAEDLVVTNGSQQMLHLLAELLLNPGDIVITAWPSYFVFTSTLTAFGACVRSVDIDEQGLVPEQLDTLLDHLQQDGQLSRVKALYLVSYHQNPTGWTLTADRRRQILDIIQRYSQDHRILVIEDAAYRELTDEGQAPASLKSYDVHNQYVALLQTLSKPFAPGLKIGYGLLPSDLVQPVIKLKGGRDFGSANFNQHLILKAMQTGLFHKHLQVLRKTYAVKRETMLDALATHMPDGVTWTKPTGGLYVWLTLPDTFDTQPHGALFHTKRNLGVLAVPGAYCYPNDPTRKVPTHHLRLSFSVPSKPNLRRGIQRLAQAIRQHLPSAQSPSLGQ